jgi:hypothetical protein
MKIYKLQKDRLSGKHEAVICNGWTIPFDPANTDYQEYLKWVAEGNEPEPADGE